MGSQRVGHNWATYTHSILLFMVVQQLVASLVLSQEMSAHPSTLPSWTRSLVTSKKAFLSLLAIIWNYAFSCVYLSLSLLLLASLLFSAIWKASSDNHLAFLHFFFFGIVLVTASCTMLWTSVHSHLGILSTRINPLNLFVTPVYNHEWFGFSLLFSISI